MLFLIVLHILALAKHVSSYDGMFDPWSYDVNSEAVYNVMDFGAVGDGSNEDTKAFDDAWSAACTNDGTPTILLPDGKTFLVKVINFDGSNCKFSNVHFQLEGQIVAPDSTDWTQCSPTWIGFLNINGLTLDGNGLIDGTGKGFWKETRKYERHIRKHCRNPSAIHFEGCKNVEISNVTSKDAPGVHFSIGECDQVEISNVNITAPEDSPNTDGINIRRSTNVFIKDTTIATGDDCIAINSGSQFINVSNVTCGPGHGISIGSLGKHGSYETVEDVYVKDSTFSSTQNGARIKTWEGGSGYARRITFEGITLTNAGNPIFIDQHYCAHSTCSSKGGNAVKVSDISFVNFHGTSLDQRAIQLLCSEEKGCTNIVLNDVNIVSNDPEQSAEATCAFVQGTQIETSPLVSCLSG